MTALPDGWQPKTLQELCLPVTKSDPAVIGRSKIRYIDIGSVDGATHSITDAPEIDAVGAPSRCRQLVKRGDTVFSTVRPYLEKIAYVDDTLDNQFASTGFAVLRPGPALVPKYLYYYSISRGMLDQVLPYQKGVSYPAVLDKEVRATAVPVPPLDEQHRIVDVLEDHLSRLDSAERGLRTSLARIRRLRESALVEAIETAQAHASTATKTIGALATVTTGVTPLKSNKGFYDGGTIPWITSGDLASGVVDAASQFVTARAISETSLKLVRAGAILLAMYGEGKTRGNAALLDIDATTNQACAAIQLHDANLRPWVKAVLDSNYAAMRRMAAGGVQPNLNLSLVRTIEVPVPCAEIREVALQRLREIEEQGSILRRALDATLRRVVTLRHALHASAFSGGLSAPARSAA